MAHQQLISWLDDAYSMEQGLIPILQTHADDLDAAIPGAAKRIRDHIGETREHAARLTRCLAILNTRPSQVKSTISSLLGNVESVATRPFQDELVKNALMDYASENLEAACYRALAVAARQLGHAEIAELCDQNRQEEEAMARWLEQQLPVLVGRTLTLTPATPR